MSDGKIELKLKDWAYNAGLLGFINILETSDGEEKVRKFIDDQNRCLKFSKEELLELLEDFEYKYFDFFIKRYGKTLTYGKILEFEKYIDDLLEKIENLIINNRKKVVAIGELGLDYYWDKEENTRNLQKIMMIKQIKLANKLKLPIVIHTRDATIDMIKLLQENVVEKKGIMHCVPINEHLIKETLKIRILYIFCRKYNI